MQTGDALSPWTPGITSEYLDISGFAKITIGNFTCFVLTYPTVAPSNGSVLLGYLFIRINRFSYK